MQKDKWQGRAGRLICAAIILLGVYIALKYALGLLLPFLGAWAIAAVSNTLARKSEAHLRGSQRAWSAFYVSVFWGLLLVAMSALIGRVSNEAADFFEYITQEGEGIANAFGETLESIVNFPSKIPFLKSLSNSEGLGELGKRIEKAFSTAISAVAQKGSELLAVGVGKLALGTPRAVIALIVCVMSSFYLALDYGKIKDYLLKIFSKDNQKKISRLAQRIGQGLKGYARAYFFLFLITFAELYIGLWALGRKYAFLIALALAAIDILPLFGAGMVLVPWSVILIAQGNYATGIGMLVLFGVMTVVRQIAEPRLVGGSLGIHPLASLASMFVGFRVFGFWGMILAPVGVLTVKELIESKEKSEETVQKTL